MSKAAESPSIHDLVSTFTELRSGIIGFINRQRAGKAVTAEEVRAYLGGVKAAVRAIPPGHPALAITTQHAGSLADPSGPKAAVVSAPVVTSLELVVRAVLDELKKSLPPIHIPSPSEYFLARGLYDRFPLVGADAVHVLAIEFFDETITTHCAGCGTASIFRGVPTNKPNVTNLSVNPPLIRTLMQSQGIEGSAYFTVEGTVTQRPIRAYVGIPRAFTNVMHCTRDPTHKLMFHSLVADKHLQKIGQFPSLADLSSHDLDRYRKVLGARRMTEFKRAVGLAAHGVGAGAFVYLRRIFEGLIHDAVEAAAGDAGWDATAFAGSRMGEKILLLRAHLPQFLVDNRQAYGILSKGVHELSDEECLQHFAVVRAAIELILEDEIARKEHALKVKAAQAAIATLGSQLKPAVTTEEP